MRVHRHPAATVASFVALVAAVGLSLSSCSLATGRHEREWDTAQEMARSSDSASVPSLVAADATDIRLSSPAVGEGGTFLAWHSATGITRSDCRTGPIGDAPSPAPSWWPESIPSTGWRCGWWRVFRGDDGYLAWQHLDTVSP